MRTRKSHFDTVIKNYKEKIDNSIDFTTEINRISETLKLHRHEQLNPYPKITFPSSPLKFLPPHLLHYSDNSILSCHVDSVRYSGPSVSVLTLKGEAKLRLKVAEVEEIDFKLTPEFGGVTFLEELRVVVERENNGVIELDIKEGEGYILTGISRYLMEHEVVGDGERVAVVFRDEVI